jgi:hypothetical protein
MTIYGLPIYAIGVALSAGVGASLSPQKPAGSTFQFGLGVETHFTKNWSLRAETMMIVSDNILGPAENKFAGFFVAPQYRAFLFENVYVYASVGPGYARHPNLNPTATQILSEIGLGAVEASGWGVSLSWRHISSGQVGQGNVGLDWAVFAIRHEFRGD